MVEGERDGVIIWFLHLVWVDFGWHHHQLRVPPEAVLAEYKVGQSRRQASCLTDTHLKTRNKHLQSSILFKQAANTNTLIPMQ